METKLLVTEPEQKESIKLNRGMTGKYGWEIKLFVDPQIIQRLKQLDEDLKKIYIEGDFDAEME